MDRHRIHTVVSWSLIRICFMKSVGNEKSMRIETHPLHFQWGKSRKLRCNID